MSALRRSLSLVGAGAVVATLTGCSLNTMIWGADGAAVIQAADAFVQDMASTGTSELFCPDAIAVPGERVDWKNLVAGEPERFVAHRWRAQAPLDPQWSINLQGMPPGAGAGTSYPGDVFFRDTADGLCVIDVMWWELE